jgi:ParB-like chromosome segregation protein Spo0J
MSSRAPKRLSVNSNSQLRRLQIERICLDFQPRENLIDESVAEYVERMRRREKIDPVLVCYDRKDYVLKDGFHRLEAALRLGRKSILAKITSGTRSEMTAEWQRYLAELKSNLATPPKPTG